MYKIDHFLDYFVPFLARQFIVLFLLTNALVYIILTY